MGGIKKINPDKKGRNSRKTSLKSTKKSLKINKIGKNGEIQVDNKNEDKKKGKNGNQIENRKNSKNSNNSNIVLNKKTPKTQTKTQTKTKTIGKKGTINPLNGLPYSDNYYKILDETSTLPANQAIVKKQLAKALDDFDLIIVKAETGAGKSVAIVPQILEHFNFQRKIICTQPRSINTQVATRVAEVLDDVEGKYIHFAFRHNVHTTKDTILSYETDGRVLNYFYNDPAFGFADILVIDEVHEKNPSIEFMLLFMKRILSNEGKKRSAKRDGGSKKTRGGSKKTRGESKKNSGENDKNGGDSTGFKKKLVIMSATMSPEYYQEYFKGIKSVVINIEGRAFPVKSHFLRSPIDIEQNEFVQKTFDVIKDIVNVQKKPGDILVFFPSISLIESGCQTIHNQLQSELDEKVVCLTLYRGKTEEEKEYVIDENLFREKTGAKRKIVFSTNIAESGVTIKGIKFVIDSGLSLNMTFDSAKRINVLTKEFISKFEAEQRRGRAGRLSSGDCYHLYTADEFSKFKQAQTSEILSENLDYIFMDLLRTDVINTVGDVRKFLADLIEAPSEAQIQSTLKYLDELKIINGMSDSGRLTDLGKCLHHLNIKNVGIGLAILASEHFDVKKSVIRLGAILETEPNITKWFRKPSNESEESKFKKVVASYKGAQSDLQIFLKLYTKFLEKSYENRSHGGERGGDRDKLKDWAKQNYLHLHLFHKARKMEHELIRKFDKDLPKDCLLTSSLEMRIKKMKGNSQERVDIDKNVVLSFLHGFYNQVLVKVDSGGSIYVNPHGIQVRVEAGRFNNLTSLRNTLVYMNLTSINGKINANGLINVDNGRILEEIGGE